MNPTDIKQLMASIVGTLAPQWHPEIDRLEQESQEWFNRQHLPSISPARRERLRSSRIGAGIGAAFPTAGYPAVDWYARFSIWFTAFDDAHAEGNAAHDLPGYLREAGEAWRMTLDTLPPEIAGTPFAAALADLLRELDDLVGDLVASRIRQALRDYFFAAAWEAAALQAATPPNADEYHSFRRHFGLWAICVEFVEHLPGLLLDERQRRDPAIREIRGLACDIFTDVNDLCSYKAENARDNLPLPAQETQADVTVRFDDLADACRTRVQRILDVTDSLTSFTELHSYAKEVVRFVAGVTWWHQQALHHRYLTV